MSNDILTTEGARQWLAKRTRTALTIVVVSWALVQLLVVGAIFGRAFADVGVLSLEEMGSVVVIGRKGGIMTFYNALWMSMVALGLIFGAFGVWFVGRRIKHRRRLEPILSQGTRIEGTVSAADTTQLERGNMTYALMNIQVLGSDGHHYQARLEEPIGTDLPRVAPSQRASVWNASGRLVIAAGGGLFEAAA